MSNDFLGIINGQLPSSYQLSADSIKSYATAFILNVITYPLELATFLFQLGYVPPTTENVLAYSYDGTALYKIPGVFQYIYDLYKYIGLTNMSHGLTVKLVRNLVYTTTSQKMAEHAPNILSEVIQHQEAPNLSFESFKEVVAISTLKHSSSVILSHPFHVLSYLQAAQIIGNENMYNGFFLNPMLTIVEDHGFMGLWAGLTPRLCMTVLSFLLSDVIEWFIRAKYVPGDNVSPLTLEGQVLQLGKSIGMVLGQVMTPSLPAVSSVMLVRGSGLIAGEPPYALKCNNWIRCRYLVVKNKYALRKLGIITDYTPYPIVVVP